MGACGAVQEQPVQTSDVAASESSVSQAGKAAGKPVETVGVTVSNLADLLFASGKEFLAGVNPSQVKSALTASLSTACYTTGTTTDGWNYVQFNNCEREGKIYNGILAYRIVENASYSTSRYSLELGAKNYRVDNTAMSGTIYLYANQESPAVDVNLQFSNATDGTAPKGTLVIDGAPLIKAGKDTLVIDGSGTLTIEGMTVTFPAYDEMPEEVPSWIRAFLAGQSLKTNFSGSLALSDLGFQRGGPCTVPMAGSLAVDGKLNIDGTSASLNVQATMVFDQNTPSTGIARLDLDLSATVKGDTYPIGEGHHGDYQLAICGQ
jgi:hypothetical protein